MIFLNPSYLYALFGLLIPIGIHLWSKKEGRTIKVGSIELLKESDSKQSSSIQLNEWWLLLLRMLLISLLVFILAEPRIKQEYSQSEIVYLFEPSLLSDSKMTSIFDTIPDENVRVLKSGFSEVGDYQRDNSISPNYWQLATEMEALHSDSIVVFTNALMSGIKGKRPQISSNIRWVEIDTQEPLERIIEAKRKNNEVQLLSVISNSQSLAFKKNVLSIDNEKLQISNTGDSVSFLQDGIARVLHLDTIEDINVAIFYDESFQNESSYVESTFRAISNYLDRPIEIQKTQSIDSLDFSAAQNIVWLSEKKIDSFKGNILEFQRDSLANSLIEPGSSPNHFYLTQNLNAENVLEENLPEQLLDFLDIHPDLNQKVRPYDQRIIGSSDLIPNKIPSKNGIQKAGFLDISAWLWVGFVIMLLGERILARYRKQ